MWAQVKVRQLGTAPRSAMGYDVYSTHELIRRWNRGCERPADAVTPNCFLDIGLQLRGVFVSRVTCRSPRVPLQKEFDHQLWLPPTFVRLASRRWSSPACCCARLPDQFARPLPSSGELPACHGCYWAPSQLRSAPIGAGGAPTRLPPYGRPHFR